MPTISTRRAECSAGFLLFLGAEPLGVVWLIFGMGRRVPLHIVFNVLGSVQLISTGSRTDWNITQRTGIVG